MRAGGWLAVILETNYRMIIYFCKFILKEGREIHFIYMVLGQENRGLVPVQDLLFPL